MTDVIVIGGGMGGLSAAIHLAARGARVRLIEKNERLGGKLNVWQSGGFTFDTGPHVLTMLFALEELFQAAGETLTDHLDLKRLDPICRYHFPNGETLDAPANLSEAERGIAEFAPGDLEGFRQFVAYARNVYEKTTDTFLRKDVADAMRSGGPAYTYAQMQGFLSLRPFEPLQKCVSRYFSDDRLRQVFNLYAVYSGSHPARCSAIFSTVAHVQWSLGTYYPMGGLYKLSKSVQDLAQKLGVRIETTTEATRILTRGGRTHGVAAQYQGTEVRYFADAVVCNEDCLTANYNLLSERERRSFPDSRIESLEPSTSAFLLLLGIRGEYPQLAHHNSFLTGDEDGEYTSLFDQQRPYSDPTIGVACQSITDPSKAPPGHSNLFVMANVPALSRHFQWTSKAIADYRKAILDRLERLGLTGLSERIVVEQIWTPLDLQSRYAAWRGAIYGLSSNGWRQAFLRPPQVSPDVKGLYFVGGSTHPGGGVPLCALSGRIVADKVMAPATGGKTPAP